MFDDVSYQALRVSLSGLAQRQKVIANNISNVETPNFRASKVQFEQALQAAVSEGRSPAEVSPTVARSLEPTRLNGNNVNLDSESLSHIETNLRYQLTLRALDSRYSGLRSVISGH